MRDERGYVNGYIERHAGGKYEGMMRIDGVDISPIEGVYFKREDGITYLWLKRKTILIYDPVKMTYTTREREPRWEAYLKKEVDDNAVAFRGEFAFLRFRYGITGVWDAVTGRDRGRLNFYVDCLPPQEQTIIRAINERKRNETE